MSNQPISQIPVQLARRRLDAQNPTLIPNLGVPVSSGKGTLDVMDPTTFLGKYPRTSANVTATIGGTVTASTTVHLTLTWGLLAGGAETWTYDVVSGDTLETIAAALIDLINESATAQTYGIEASSGEEAHPDEVVVTLFGPAANSAVLSGGASADETVTISPSGGAFSGATGPIIPLENFSFGWNGTRFNLWYGIPANIGLDAVAAMVSQGLPIL